MTATAPQTRTYTAKVVRFGEWWAIDVPELLGVHTQTRSLGDVEAMATDAIAAVLDVRPETISIRVDTELDEETARLVQEATAARDAAARAQTEANEVVASTVGYLGRRGVSVRDAGYLLGISYQRVAQIRNKNVSAAFRRRDSRSAPKGRSRTA